MADVENQQEPALPAKRKSDLCYHDEANPPSKAPKLENEENPQPQHEHNGESNIQSLDSAADEKIESKSAGFDAENSVGRANFEGEGEKKEQEEDTKEEEEKEEEEAEVVDRKGKGKGKGKGIVRDNKGKGKLFVEDDGEGVIGGGDEDDDDSSDELNELDDGSDLSDDPLFEVDLDNILPSRTRRRQVHPGFYITNEIRRDDDDDSDDDDDDDDDDGDDDEDDDEDHDDNDDSDDTNA